LGRAQPWTTERDRSRAGIRASSIAVGRPYYHHV